MDGGYLMTALNTLKQASYYELSLTVEGGQLRLASPNPPPSELLERLKANKSLLIKHLALYQNADFETAKAAWYGHYWGCDLCKNHHTKFKKPAIHPCNEGELLVEVYNKTI